MTSQDDNLQLHDRSVLSAVDAQAAGRFGLALELFHESLDHAKALAVRRKIHAALINISSCYLSLGDWAAARAGLPAIILQSDEPRHVSATTRSGCISTRYFDKDTQVISSITISKKSIESRSS